MSSTLTLIKQVSNSWSLRWLATGACRQIGQIRSEHSDSKNSSDSDCSTKQIPKKRGKTPKGKLDDEFDEAPSTSYHEKEPLKKHPGGINPDTGEYGGPSGPEPTRYGDWERKGRVTDF